MRRTFWIHFWHFLMKNNLSSSGLANLCTDGAPSMRGKEKGLFGLIKKGEEKQNFIRFHCIIHQESLVSKLRNNTFQNVMQTVVRVVNFFISRALIEDCDRLWWFTDAQWSEMVVPWKNAWTVSVPPPWDLHFPGQQRKTGARAGGPMLDPCLLEASRKR